jgi:hypothetical protein
LCCLLSPGCGVSLCCLRLLVSCLSCLVLSCHVFSGLALLRLALPYVLFVSSSIMSGLVLVSSVLILFCFSCLTRRLLSLYCRLLSTRRLLSSDCFCHCIVFFSLLVLVLGLGSWSWSFSLFPFIFVFLSCIYLGLVSLQRENCTVLRRKMEERVYFVILEVSHHDHACDGEDNVAHFNFGLYAAIVLL